MNRSCTIIVNAKAGALKLTPSAETIAALAKEIGLDAEVVGTESAGEMRHLVKDLVKAGVKKIVVAGGDGTVRLAAQEMAYSDSVLGIIPQGTANNFANALHLPMDLRSALRTIKDGEVRKVSLGKIGDHYFTESAGVGLFANGLALYGNGTNKNLLKASWALLGTLLSFPPSRVKVTADGKEIIQRAAMCTVANTFRMGLAYPIAPEAVLTDDFLDVVIVGDLRRRELPAYFRAMQAQAHPALDKVEVLKAQTVTIESLRGLNVYADDRVIGTTPVTITVEPKALSVLVERL